MQVTDAAVSQLHQKAIVCVTHDHRPIAPDLPLMIEGGVTAKLFQFALDVDVEAGLDASRNRTEGWLRLATAGLEEALRDIQEHPDQCILATTAQDIRRAKRDGKVAILLGTEGTRWLEGSLEPLRLFYRLGLRELQLTWALPNDLAPDGSLSSFGKEVVEECRRLGILVDLTHVPENVFWSVVNQNSGPLIISHGAAAGVTTDMDDAHLLAIAATGGLIGIHFFTTYLGQNPSPDDVVKQVDYLAQCIGINHIALGVDFFPTDGVWKKFQQDQNTPNLRWAIKDFSEMPRISRCLLEHGYSEEDVEKVLGGNFMRVCEQVFGS